MATTEWIDDLPNHYWVRTAQRRNNVEISILRYRTGQGGINPKKAYVLSSEQGFEAFVELDTWRRPWCLGAFHDPTDAELQIVSYWRDFIAKQVAERMEDGQT